jgi:peptide/nickel transport system substrate-binding protein
MSKPGLVSAEVQRYFWMPLPQHVWGKYSAEELLTVEESSRAPLGWGAYVLEEWRAGEYIRLTRNPGYYQPGLPKLDFLEYRFLTQGTGPIEMVKSGKCDVVDSSAISYEVLKNIVNESNAGTIKSFVLPGKEWEVMAFGIKPVSYDDGYYLYGTDRPDFFNDVRTRQAIAYCIDRAGIVNDLLFGLSEVPLNSLPSSHPWQVGGLSPITMDINKANELLSAAGWADYDQNPATPRVAANVANII